MQTAGKLCRLLVNRPLGVSSAYQRMLSMHRINENLYLCTEKPREIRVDKKDLRFTMTKENTKPVVLLISWFYGRPSQINKYSKMYTDHGMDVIVGRISLVQFLASIKKAELFGQQISDVLSSNQDHYPEIFIHTFSAGGGMWGISQRMMHKNFVKYGNIFDRIIGQVWDSVAHPSQTAVAIPFALFPKNMIMQSSVRFLLRLHLKTYKTLTDHFENAMQHFYLNLSRAPALVIASKVDPIGTDDFNQEIVAKWKAHGMDVNYVCFDDSEHIKHMQKYPKEYTKAMHDLWDKVKLLERK